MGSIYIKDRWGHRTGSGAMISILSPREELTTILLFSEAGIVHIVQIHHGADKLLRLPVVQLGTDGQGRVSPHSFQSLSHSLCHTVCVTTSRSISSPQRALSRTQVASALFKACARTRTTLLLASIALNYRLKPRWTTGRGSFRLKAAKLTTN